MTFTSILFASLMMTAQPQGDADDQVETDAETTEVAATEQEEVDDENKVICRRTAVVGSKFKKKMCGTKKQWETLEARSRDAAQRAQSRGKGLDPNGG